MPQITVIITTYNRGNLLKDAINSILNQSFSDFELIVVDDCSFKDPEEIIKNFKDDRIIYIRHKKNKGDAAAKNTGIKAAKGKYIVSLDDDDLMAPWALKELFYKIKDSSDNVCGVYGWSWWTHKNGKTLRFVSFQKKGRLFDDIFKNQIFTNILLKKEVFDSVGLYDESLKSNYDYDFYLRLAQKYEFDFVSRILFIIRAQEGEHLSKLSDSHMKIHEKVMQKYVPEAKSRGVFALKFLPKNIYFKLSVVKNKIISFFKFIKNKAIRRDLKELKL